jgi:hypothetical protein
MKFKVIDMYGKPGYMNPMRNYTNRCSCGNKKQFVSKTCKSCCANKKNSGLTRITDRNRQKKREYYILTRSSKFNKPYAPYNVQVLLPLKCQAV